MPEAFAAVREAARRVLGQRHFDVQIMGGVVLHRGALADIKTGEGKTLTATLAAYLNALTGRGVHIVTANDYLASRDAEWMGGIYRFLDLKVGLIRPAAGTQERQAAYGADVSYGGNTQFGYDYLHDNMAYELDECVQRGHTYAIVDEADWVLIDEARSSLMITGPGEVNRWHAEFAKIAPLLRREVHYTADENSNEISLTDAGAVRVEDLLGIDDLYDAKNNSLTGPLWSALMTKEFYRRDREYLVQDGEVVIIHSLTGRPLPDRLYVSELQQAIEAKEGLPVRPERQLLATVSVQNYFRRYEKIAAMTGTAAPDAAEYRAVYGLEVIEIPTARPVLRVDRPDRVYETQRDKHEALLNLVAERHAVGQPVLVGTHTVQESEHISALLSAQDIAHRVLNARNAEHEAEIMAQAGTLGAVTVSTGMTGRGTDIELGGAAECGDESETPPADAVRALGGLLVIGTERFPYRRLDHHLRGRAGRRGDPGESQFLLDLDTSLSTLPPRQHLMVRKLVSFGPTSRAVNNSVQSMQRIGESRAWAVRAELLKYDEVVNEQRLQIYAERRAVLQGDDISGQVHKMINNVLEDEIEQVIRETPPTIADLQELCQRCRELYPISVTADELIGLADLAECLRSDAAQAYDHRTAELGDEIMRQLERRVILSVTDRDWRTHLLALDALQEDIGLRLLGKRDPVAEFRRESTDLFNAMVRAIKKGSVGYLFHLEVEMEPDPTIGG